MTLKQDFAALRAQAMARNPLRYSIRARREGGTYKVFSQGSNLDALTVQAESFAKNNHYAEVVVYDSWTNKIADGGKGLLSWKLATAIGGFESHSEGFMAESFNNRTGKYHRTYHWKRSAAERRLRGNPKHSEHKLFVQDKKGVFIRQPFSV